MKNYKSIWNNRTKEERIALMRRIDPKGKLDFYADSTWENLFGGIQQRLEKIIEAAS